MVSARSKALSSVIESEDSLHLSMYIRFTGDAVAFSARINEFLKSAEAHLSPVLSESQKQKFLSPLRSLAQNSKIIAQMNKSIGIFRRKDYLRIVSIPIDILESCVVASTFHVKPLIKWAQHDQDFALITLTAEGARVFRGSQSELREMDFIPISGSLERFLALCSQGANNSQIEERQFNHALGILVRALREVVGECGSRVFVMGQDGLLREFDNKLCADSIYPIAKSFTGADAEITKVCERIRQIMQVESKTMLAEALLEFEAAVRSGIGKTNLFQIAKAAVKGNVKKLIIAEDFSIFGKINKRTGGVILHPIDLDHEDDCLLDDLAQTVLLAGGEVLIAKREQIPCKRPIVAILKDRSGSAPEYTDTVYTQLAM